MSIKNIYKEAFYGPSLNHRKGQTGRDLKTTQKKSPDMCCIPQKQRHFGSFGMEVTQEILRETLFVHVK